MTTATFHPFPADSSRAPMNACRQNLAAAIAALADEIQILEETMRPTVRLGELGLDLEQLDREIAALKVPHEQRVGNWIAAGQVGERPQPSLRISTLEARRRLLAGDVAAPEHMCPAGRSGPPARLCGRPGAPSGARMCGGLAIALPGGACPSSHFEGRRLGRAV